MQGETVNENTANADFSVETWVVPAGGVRTIDVAHVDRLRVGLVAGEVSVMGHDGTDTRIEIEQVLEHEVHVTLDHGTLQINQPKRNWRETFSAAASFIRSRTSASVTLMVPRTASVKVSTATAEALVSGMHAGASVNTASGDIQLSAVIGSIDVNTASSRVDIDGLDGDLEVRSVSGELTAAGRTDRLGLETVSGSALLDLEGAPKSVTVHSVSGDVTVRLDRGPGVSLDFKSLSGEYTVDGQTRKGKGSPRVEGEPNIRIACNSVSGDLTVVRR